MDENTTKLIKQRFDSLPKMVQEAILSSDYENSLLEIGKQHQLNVEQLGILEQETTMTMMGLTPLNNFETELTRELHIDKEKGAQIVKDINEKVFLKIRELLKLMNTGNLEESDMEEKKETSVQASFIKPEQHETEAEKKNNTQVFSEHGIEILPEKLEITTSEKPTTAPIAGIITPKPSILAQKLSIPVQTPTVKTSHSLPNLAPSSEQDKPKFDPYREIPE